MSATARLPVLTEQLWRGRGLSHGLGRSVVLVVVGTATLALSAKLQVPFWPVPMTLQTLAVLLIGLAYGPRLAGLTVAAYLAEGLAGLPVFAGAAAGPAYMAGPTGGYLAGFLLAAVAAGWLAERGWDRKWVGAAAAMALGHALVFVPGVFWLSLQFGWDKAVAVGFTPFIAGSLVKIALGATMAAAAWRGTRAA